MTEVRRPWALLALPLLLAACTTSPTSASAAGPPAGETTGANAQDSHASAASGPAPAASSDANHDTAPQAAAMICGTDIKTKMQNVLNLPAPPTTASSWNSRIYTCSYHLPVGPMTLSVEVLSDNQAAAARLDTERAALSPTHPLSGLGERAFGTTAGAVVVLKDDMTLTVDATKLPTVFGSNQQRNTDLAYEVASDVLGCWTGDE